MKTTATGLVWPTVPRTAREPKTHGTRASYQNYGCRCGGCRAAHAAYVRGYRTRKPRIYRPRKTSVPVGSLDAFFRDQTARIRDTVTRSAERVRLAHVSALLTDHGGPELEIRK